MGPAAPPLLVQWRVEGRRCVVVGGGAVGARRARTLCDAGADVVVVAPEVHPDLDGVEGIQLVRRPFEPADVQGATLVVAATGVREVDDRVGASASAAGIPVNRVDDASAGDVVMAAVRSHGPLRVAVATGGRAPAVTRWAADRLAARFEESLGLTPAALELLVDIVEEVRTELLAAGRDGADSGVTAVTSPAFDWRRAFDASILELTMQGRRAEAKERLLACLSSS